MATDTDQTLKTPTVLLLGASSQIGVFAIPQLILAGFRVLAVSRKGKPEGYAVFEQVEWLNEADAAIAAQSCEHLLSTGPLELAKKFLAPESPDDATVTPGSTRGPFQTAVIFSSSSVETKEYSNNPAERSQVNAMQNLESDLRLVAEDSGLKLVILRPTLIYGCGLDTNISRLAAYIRRYGVMPVNGKAAGLRQPVHAEDLASVAINALLSTKALPDVMFLGGGDTLSYSDMVKRIFIALEKPARLIRLPEWLFVLLIRLVGSSKIGAGTNAEMVKRQRLDLKFDDQLARELLYHNPRPFAPVAADFSLPEF